MKIIATLALLALPMLVEAQTKPIVWGNFGFGAVIGIEREDRSSGSSLGLGFELPLSRVIRFNVEGGFSQLHAIVDDYYSTEYHVDEWVWIFPTNVTKVRTLHLGYDETTNGKYLQAAFAIRSSSTAVLCLEANVGATMRFASMEKFKLYTFVPVASLGFRVEPETSATCVRGGWGWTQGHFGGYLSIGFKI